MLCRHNSTDCDNCEIPLHGGQNVRTLEKRLGALGFGWFITIHYRRLRTKVNVNIDRVNFILSSIGSDALQASVQQCQHRRCE